MFMFLNYTFCISNNKVYWYKNSGDMRAKTLSCIATKNTKSHVLTITYAHAHPKTNQKYDDVQIIDN